MPSKTVCVVLLVVTALAGCLAFERLAQENTVNVATVYYDSADKTFSFVEGKLDKTKGCAWALFNDSIPTTGWSRLFVETSSQFSDLEQAYAAGLVEGRLTSTRIHQHYLNMLAATFRNKSMSEPVRKFFRDQEAYLLQEAAANPQDAYWQQAALMVQQWHGLVDGYNAAVPASMRLASEDMQVMNAFGDLFDIVPAVDPALRPDYERMSREELRRYTRLNNHCSGFVRVTPDLSELFAGHTSWFTYSAMLRVLKSYNFPYTGVAATKMVFSSYPATLGSNDDFYVTSAGLYAMETTNGILNTTLFDFVTPHAPMCFQRVAIANRLAHSAPQWIQIFSRLNSGTYNNQWTVVDFNKFVPGQPLQADTVWIAEQTPGLIVSSDRTNDLYFGYWPSYNVPAQQEIYERSGYDFYAKKYGDEYTWGMCPRAKVFRERASTVTDVTSMQKFMRYNDYQHDPVANNDPGHAVASRFDLEQGSPSANGGYDSKITWSGAVKAVSMSAISGPTADQQPPFAFTGAFATAPHTGMPTEWNFGWEQFSADDWQ